MKIIIDSKKCIGCGRCTEVCPANFKLSTEGKSQIIQNPISNCTKKASDECPTEAIHIEI